MMQASELAARLAQNAEQVCRYYLSAGRRRGGYWLVGDVHNTPGRSLFVRLKGAPSGRGARGKWQDAASGEYGDLLDLIRLNCGLGTFRETAEEARRFLALPAPEPKPVSAPSLRSRDAATPKRLYSAARSIRGSLAEIYLLSRGIDPQTAGGVLRFHPTCFFRPDDAAPLERWPAMIAPVTNNAGVITGVHRTYLARDGRAKASFEEPRRSLGELNGHAVRFGPPAPLMVAGEGIETVLSLRTAFPEISMLAALSSAHLAALILPPGVETLYVARDRDAAGEQAWKRLAERVSREGVELFALDPQGRDFNVDLQRVGVCGLREAVRPRLAVDAGPSRTERSQALPPTESASVVFV